MDALPNPNPPHFSGLGTGTELHWLVHHGGWVEGNGNCNYGNYKRSSPSSICYRGSGESECRHIENVTGS